MEQNEGLFHWRHGTEDLNPVNNSPCTTARPPGKGPLTSPGSSLWVWTMQLTLRLDDFTRDIFNRVELFCILLLLFCIFHPFVLILPQVLGNRDCSKWFSCVKLFNPNCHHMFYKRNRDKEVSWFAPDQIARRWPSSWLHSLASQSLSGRVIAK